MDGRAFGGTVLLDRHRIVCGEVCGGVEEDYVVYEGPFRSMPTKPSRWNRKRSERRKMENMDENDTVIGDSSSGCRRSIRIEAESEVSESRWTCYSFGKSSKSTGAPRPCAAK